MILDTTSKENKDNYQIEIDLEKGRIGLNTALLENSAGELIIDKQKVMQEATERALKTKALFDKKEQNK